MLYYFLYQFIFQQYGATSESYFFKGLTSSVCDVPHRVAAITALLISLFLAAR